jgi:hypothetical protein
VAAVPAMNSRRCPLIKEHANPCGWALKRPSLQQAFEGAWPGPESVTRESALGLQAVYRGVVAEQDFDDHRLHGYHSS